MNFLFVSLNIGFFAVTLPKLIRGKLRRLRYPQCEVGFFPFRTPMRDSAVDYLAARHAYLPIANFLLRRQGHDAGDAGVTDDQPTLSHPARLADVVAAARRAAVPPPPPSTAAPPSAARINELLHLGDAHRDEGEGDAGTALSGRGRIRARSHRLPRRACGTSLALVVMSLVLFMPALIQGFMVDEIIVMVVSLVMVAALGATSIARLSAAACGELVRAHTAAVFAAAIAAVAVVVIAGISLLARRAARARRAHRRSEEARLGGAFDAEIYARETGAWCWLASGGRARADDAALFRPIDPQGAPSRHYGIRSARSESV